MNLRTALYTAMLRRSKRITTGVCKHCGAKIASVCGVWIHSETPPEVCFFASPQPTTKQESTQ